MRCLCLPAALLQLFVLPSPFFSRTLSGSLIDCLVSLSHTHLSLTHAFSLLSLSLAVSRAELGDLACSCAVLCVAWCTTYSSTCVTVSLQPVVPLTTNVLPHPPRRLCLCLDIADYACLPAYTDCYGMKGNTLWTGNEVKALTLLN